MGPLVSLAARSAILCFVCGTVGVAYIRSGRSLLVARSWYRRYRDALATLLRWRGLVVPLVPRASRALARAQGVVVPLVPRPGEGVGVDVVRA